MLLVILAAFLFSVQSSFCQFPAVCNTQTNLDAKTCCPNDCGGVGRGTCRNIVTEVAEQWELANSTITGILLDAPNEPQKGTADARYLWPTVVFENVCECSGNFGGVDCAECDFGWTGSECNTMKTPVIRKPFSNLTPTEQQSFINATMELKNEMGFWAVIVEEPATYESGTVTLQNVSTYNFFIYLHDYVARDDTACTAVNNGNILDFAHSGPVFPVWHRRYVLTVEKEFQRIMANDSFGFPYWQWEEDDRSPFTLERYGLPSNVYGSHVDVQGTIINPQAWNTVCDLTYNTSRLNCSDYWRPCNPERDLQRQTPLQRGNHQSTYLPNIVEVMIAIAAPLYDAPDMNGCYLRDDPRTSFRSRLEGWNIICSAMMCTGPQNKKGNISHMHNGVHVWMGGQMDVIPAAVNDPTFNLHHCNVDRILESWMKRFTSGNPQLLPPYVPTSGGHPGHNRDDYIVPFFPLIKAGEQYRVTEEWGYTYDSLIPASIPDSVIPNCIDIFPDNECPICDANGTCIDCTTQTCPQPFTFVTPAAEPLQEDSSDSLALGLGLGLGLGIPLLIAIAVIIILIIVVVSKLQTSSGRGKDIDLIVKT